MCLYQKENFYSAYSLIISLEKKYRKVKAKNPTLLVTKHSNYVAFLKFILTQVGSAPSISIAAFQTCRNHLFVLFTSTALVY